MLLKLTENEFYFVRQAFCGLEYAENAFVAGALARTPMGELTTLPQTPYSAGEATPLPDLTPLRHLDPRASGARVCPRTHNFWLRH